METINNIASTASKAIWGEQTAATNETAGKEPISGVQGTGIATDPYDQGNAATPNEPTGKSDPFNSASTAPTTITKTELPIRTTTNDLSGAAPPTDISESAPSTTGIPKSNLSSDITPKSDETSKPQIPLNPTSLATGGEPKPLENIGGTGVTGATQNFTPTGGAVTDVKPSESSASPGVVPASGAAPFQKHLGSEAPIDKKEDDEKAILKNDHAGVPSGQEHGKEPKGKGRDSVKTSALAADGGDFDVKKPGAGKEADRLLEEKSIQRDAKGHTNSKPETSKQDTSPGGVEKEKVSKMDKLKEKLHIGHKDK